MGTEKRRVICRSESGLADWFLGQLTFERETLHEQKRRIYAVYIINQKRGVVSDFVTPNRRLHKHICTTRR